MNPLELRLQQTIEWIRQTTDVAGGRGALIPVSGGSDSALCFWLCAQALPPGRAVGVYVGSELRCRDWFEQLGTIRFLPPPTTGDHPEAQRWTMMLCQSLESRGWLVGTRNRTEDVFGTYSLASRVATYLPLAGFWKTEVMTLAESVGVPEEILHSSRRADPSCGRPEEMAAIEFETVDRFLQVRVGERPDSDLVDVPVSTLNYLDSIYCRNRFKMELPLRKLGS